jgi:hypothetical protein
MGYSTQGQVGQNERALDWVAAITEEHGKFQHWHQCLGRPFCDK